MSLGLYFPGFFWKGGYYAIVNFIIIKSAFWPAIFIIITNKEAESHFLGDGKLQPWWAKLDHEIQIEAFHDNARPLKHVSNLSACLF